MHREQRKRTKLATHEMGLHYLLEDSVQERRGREKALTLFLPRQFCLWANNRAGYNLWLLPVVRGVWVGLHTEPCGCQVTGWRSS